MLTANRLIMSNWLIKIADINSKIQLLSNKYQLDVDFIRQLASYDPSPNKAYLDWICRQAKQQSLRFPEDAEKTIETLKDFHKYKSLLPIKDINQYKFLGDISKAIETSGRVPSKREQEKINTETGQQVVLDMPPYKVISITTPEASATLCRGTKWCIKDPSSFIDEYHMGPDNPALLILKDDKRYALMHIPTGQLKDLYDNPFDNKSMEFIDLFREMVKRNIITHIPVGDNFGMDILSKLSKDEVLSSPGAAYYYAQNVIKGRWPEGENAISKDPKYAYSYACILNWQNVPPEIIQSIIEDPRYAYNYARNVLRWQSVPPEVIQSIIKDPLGAYRYANGVLNWQNVPDNVMEVIRNSEYAKHIPENLREQPQQTTHPPVPAQQTPQAAYVQSSWLIKIAQSKPMPVPFRETVPFGRGGVGPSEIDKRMTPYTSENQESEYPHAKYLGHGFQGLAYDLGGNRVLKYTGDQHEISRARESMRNPSTCLVKIFDVEQIQYPPDETLWFIISEKAKALTDEEGEIVSMMYGDLAWGTSEHIHWRKEYIGNERIYQAYLQMLQCLEKQNFSTIEAAENNVGWVGNRLVLFDLGPHPTERELM